MEGRDEAQGLSEAGAEPGVAVAARDTAGGGQSRAGGGDVPGVWVVTIGVRGEDVHRTEGAVIFGPMSEFFGFRRL
jgi:hypothetical protein